MAVDVGHRVLPCLLTTDMRRTLEFYVEALGFIQTGYYPIESDPVRTEVRRDGVAIVFFTEAYHGVGDVPSFSGMLYFFAADVDALTQELDGKVTLEWGPEESELGVREVAIRDPDGYLLVFAERS